MRIIIWRENRNLQKKGFLGTLKWKYPRWFFFIQIKIFFFRFYSRQIQLYLVVFKLTERGDKKVVSDVPAFANFQDQKFWLWEIHIYPKSGVTMFYERHLIADVDAFRWL